MSFIAHSLVGRKTLYERPLLLEVELLEVEAEPRWVVGNLRYSSLNELPCECREEGPASDPDGLALEGVDSTNREILLIYFIELLEISTGLPLNRRIHFRGVKIQR